MLLRGQRRPTCFPTTHMQYDCVRLRGADVKRQHSRTDRSNPSAACRAATAAFRGGDSQAGELLAKAMPECDVEGRHLGKVLELAVQPSAPEAAAGRVGCGTAANIVVGTRVVHLLSTQHDPIAAQPALTAAKRINGRALASGERCSIRLRRAAEQEAALGRGNTRSALCANQRQTKRGADSIACRPKTGS